MQTDIYYHIYNHGNGDDNIFREVRNYDFFMQKYKKHVDPIADTYAWCLLPNHFHMLVKIKSDEEIGQALPKFAALEEQKRENFISKQFANFFSSYTQSFNKVYKRRGSLFLKNFKRVEIDTSVYLFNLILYIHLNPSKHGFKTDSTHWPWSSFHNFPENQPDLFKELFTDHDFYLQSHADRKEKFDAYHTIEQTIT